MGRPNSAKEIALHGGTQRKVRLRKDTFQERKYSTKNPLEKYSELSLDVF